MEIDKTSVNKDKISERILNFIRTGGADVNEVCTWLDLSAPFEDESVEISFKETSDILDELVSDGKLSRIIMQRNGNRIPRYFKVDTVFDITQIGVESQIYLNGNTLKCVNNV